MAHITSALILLSLLSVGFGQLAYNYITTDNGAKWGAWGPGERCPNGYKAKGFSLKVEQNQGEGDDTAVNGIRLLCYDPEEANRVAVQSSVSEWGRWTPIMKCSSGHIEAYQLKVEGNQGDGDDTAVNNLKIQCSNGEKMEGAGTPWGSYGSWSKVCVFGVCGIKAKVEAPQGKGDDTSLNDVKMLCCDE